MCWGCWWHHTRSSAAAEGITGSDVGDCVTSDVCLCWSLHEHIHRDARLFLGSCPDASVRYVTEECLDRVSACAYPCVWLVLLAALMT
jgi:hypothetical protein